MARLSLFLFLIAFSASAQLAPRIALSGEFTSLAQANSAKNVIRNKLDSVKSNLADSLDRPFTVSTNFGMVTIQSVDFFAGTNLQAQAIRWMQTNVFGGTGWTVTIHTHLCPGTNAVPAGWLGCELDPRARATNIVVTP